MRRLGWKPFMHEKSWMEAIYAREDLRRKASSRKLRMMYVKIIAQRQPANGKPPIIVITISTTAISKKMYLTLLSCQERFLNFMENIGIPLTSSQHSTGTMIAGSQLVTQRAGLA